MLILLHRAELGLVDIAYIIDDMATYKTKTYRCLIAHVSTLALDPEKAKTYWVEVK